MIAVLLGIGWASIVIGWGTRYQLGSVPANRLRRIGSSPSSLRTSSRLTPFCAFPERIGAVALTCLFPVAGGDDRLLFRRAGNAIIAGAAALLVSIWAVLPVMAVAWSLPRFLEQRKDRRHLARIEADLPDIIDLLTVAVSSGLTVSLAVGAVIRRSDSPLCAELSRAMAETKRGRRLADALENVPARAGEAVRPLITALTSSERYGAPLQASLERLSEECRRNRDRRAKQSAQRVPVLMLFPLVCCVLPAFALLTIAPLLASALRALRL